MSLRSDIRALVKSTREQKPVGRISFPQTIRLRVLAKSGFTCQHCGASLFEVEPHIDHVIPLSKGGTNDEENLQALCAPCNLAKGAKDDKGAKMNRKQILDEATRLTYNDREQEYGTPQDNFRRIAALWSVVLGIEVSEHQVALCMNQVKVARLVQTPEKVDGWIDAAAYMGLGGELATEK